MAILLSIFAGLTANVTAQVKPYRVTDRQVQLVVSKIQTKSANFKRAASLAINRSSLNGTATEDEFFQNIGDFEQAASALDQNVRSRNSSANDVNALFDSASNINRILATNRLSTNVQSQWTSLKTDLNTLASYYGVTWNPNRTSGNYPNNSNNNNYPNNNYPNNNTGNNSNNNSSGNSAYTTSTSNLNSLVNRIQSRTDAYKRELGYAFDRSMISNSRSRDAANGNVADFVTATSRLKQNVDSQRSTQADVQNVLNSAYNVDRFMKDYRLGSGAETQWNLIRTDLTTLAGYYNVSWGWNNPNYPPRNNNFDNNITGTYRLNANQSDDVASVVDRVSGTYQNNQRDNSRRGLERRLTSPDILVIQKTGSSVTLASSLSPQVTFQADGTARAETTPNGRSIRTTANTSYDGIDISYEGDRTNDFYINFTTVGNNQLRVVRRVYLENRNETVTVSSVYDKTANTAQFSSVDNGNNNGGNQNGGTGNLNSFIVPNNTTVTTTLVNLIDTKQSQVGDRFQLQVVSPSEYNNAVIEGRVTAADNSGRISGRANLSFEFDTIKLANGQTYRFAGIINSVKTPNGDTVSVNNEGTVRDDSQTTKTVTRAGIGAALGAIIGAVTGGGQGAAIGAAVGAGAGAGTVVLQGKDGLQLNQGSTFMLTATAPNNSNR